MKRMLLGTAAVLAIFMVTTGPAAAQAAPEPGEAAALACGSGKVFLDGIRALDVLEEGERDEVYIRNQNGAKIWPVTADYVSMAEGQRAEVDKCVPVGTTLRLWDDDGALNPDDFMGIATIFSESTANKYFDNGSSRYRLGVVA